jgi:hypothetical protein
MFWKESCFNGNLRIWDVRNVSGMFFEAKEFQEVSTQKVNTTGMGDGSQIT